MNFTDPIQRILSRRAFLTRSTTGLGGIALATLLNPSKASAATATAGGSHGALPGVDWTPRARRVIYLFQSGAPSHLDLFDPKPRLREMTGQELPPSVRQGQRITGMTAGQAVLRCVGSAYDFQR